MELRVLCYRQTWVLIHPMMGNDTWKKCSTHMATSRRLCGPSSGQDEGSVTEKERSVGFDPARPFGPCPQSHGEVS